MGMSKNISSVRPVDWDARYENQAPPPSGAPPDYDYRERPGEPLFQAQVTSVHAVMGPPEQRCWVEQQQVVNNSGPNIGGAIIGGILGGVLGHQIGGGVGRDVATAGGAVAGAAVGSNVGRRANRYPRRTCSAAKTFPTRVRLHSGMSPTTSRASSIGCS